MTATHPTQLPRLLRLREILTIIPVSKSTWWNGVAKGKFPQPIKLGPKTTVWPEQDIIDYLESLSAGTSH